MQQQANQAVPSPYLRIERLKKRFGNFYGDVVQSFLMTQGVLNEDDLMVRDDLKMLATAKVPTRNSTQLEDTPCRASQSFAAAPAPPGGAGGAE